MTAVGIVTGLRAEADLLRRALARHSGLDYLISCRGLGAPGAAAAVRELVEHGVGALASVGLCGGLNPALPPGTVIVARRILAESGEHIDTDKAWRSRVLAQLIGNDAVIDGALLAANGPVTDPRLKDRLYRASGASALDMESFAVAKLARQNGLPYLAVRAIADPARRMIPRIALAGLRADGAVDALAVLRKSLPEPGTWLPLMRLAADRRRAFAALRRVAAVLVRAAPAVRALEEA